MSDAYELLREMNRFNRMISASMNRKLKTVDLLTLYEIHGNLPCDVCGIGSPE